MTFNDVENGDNTENGNGNRSQTGHQWNDIESGVAQKNCLRLQRRANRVGQQIAQSERKSKSLVEKVI